MQCEKRTPDKIICEKTLSVLFEQGAAKKNIFAQQIMLRKLKQRFRGALPVDFWMLNFAEIQHRVASITLEIPATFTRHHAFLKKATQKLSSCGSGPFG